MRQQVISFLSLLGDAFGLHHHANGCSDHFYSQAFEGDSSVDIFHNRLADDLKPLVPSSHLDILTIQWLHKAAAILVGVLADVQTLIPRLEHFNSEEEKWVTDYMDNTIKFLDVLNVLRCYMTLVEHRLLHLKLAVAILDTKGGSLEMASKCIFEYLQCTEEDASSCVIKEKEVVLLEAMAARLMSVKICRLTKGKSFLSAVYAANVLAIYLFSALFVALTDKSIKPQFISQEFELFPWGAVLSELVQGLQKATGKTTVNGVGFLAELIDIHLHAEKLQECLKQSSDDKRMQDMDSIMHPLKKSLEQLDIGFTTLGQVLDKIYHVIVAGRNYLLDNLRIIPC